MFEFHSLAGCRRAEEHIVRRVRPAHHLLATGAGARELRDLRLAVELYGDLAQRRRDREVVGRGMKLGGLDIDCDRIEWGAG